MFEKDDPGTETPDEGQEPSSPETPETETPEREAPETEEEKAPQQQARGKDPTAGMTAEQQVDYWKKRYGSAQQGYERLKQQRGGLAQGYERLKQQRGGLANKQAYTPPPTPQTNGHAPVKSLDEVQTLPEFLELAKREIKAEVTQEFTVRQLDERVETTEKAAREQHDGSDGYPQYDELVDDFVVPMIEKNPRVFEILRLMENPAEAAYTLGFLLKYKNFKGAVESQARDDLVKNINKAGRQAANVKGRGSGRQVSTKLTADEIERMTPVQFEKELEKFKAAT